MRWTIATCFMIAAMALGPPGLPAQTILPPETIEETLHGFCGTSYAATTCKSNGVITPTSSLTDGFGFTREPDRNGNWTNPLIWVVFLIPNTTSSGSFTVSPPDTLLNLAGEWTSSAFDSFVGLTRTGGPQNPINAFLPSTQALVAGASGYFVYQANLGAVNFGADTDPRFTTNLDPPVGSVVFAYITTGAGTIVDSTSNGTALLLANPVPEPATIIGLGTIILVITRLARKKCARSSVIRSDPV